MRGSPGCWFGTEQHLSLSHVLRRRFMSPGTEEAALAFGLHVLVHAAQVLRLWGKEHLSKSTLVVRLVSTVPAVSVICWGCHWQNINGLSSAKS